MDCNPSTINARLTGWFVGGTLPGLRHALVKETIIVAGQREPPCWYGRLVSYGVFSALLFI